MDTCISGDRGGFDNGATNLVQLNAEFGIRNAELISKGSALRIRHSDVQEHKCRERMDAQERPHYFFEHFPCLRMPAHTPYR